MSEQASNARWHKLRKVLLSTSVSIGLLAGAGFILGIAPHREAFFEGTFSGVYWLVINHDGILSTLSFVWYAAGWLVIMFSFYGRWFERILLSVLWLIVGCGILTFSGPEMYSGYTHNTSLSTSNAVYHAGGKYSGDAICPPIGPIEECSHFGYESVVYECDRLGFMCHAIYHGDTRRYNDYHRPPISTFTTDGTTIALNLNGTLIWEHQLNTGSD
jgi:hypothetical protein